MSNKLILSILISFLCACGGGSDSTPSNNSSTNDSTNTDANSDDTDQNLVNSTPTEPGLVCRNDEPYYPLPSNYEYRKPEPGDALEYDIEESFSSSSGLSTEEYKSYSIFYNISDTSTITPNITPPFSPSTNWGDLWTTDHLISRVDQDDNSAENETNIYLFPNDGTVKIIKSDNLVSAENNTSTGLWLWGKTVLPKLENFTTFAYTSKSYEINEDTQRWNQTANFSVNNTSIRMTGIGCIETFLVQQNELWVLEFDDPFALFWEKYGWCTPCNCLLKATDK